MNVNSEINNLSINGQSTYYQQLFPYLYIGNTPKVSQQDKSNAFFIVPDSVSSSDLFLKLANNKKSEERLAMQNLAVTFINSDSFIATYQQLDLRLLPLLNIDLNDLTDKNNIIYFIEDHFNNQDEFNKFISSASTITLLTNIWLSIISMLIELDYELHWLEKLISLVKKLNIIHHALPYLSNDTEIPEVLISAWHNANFLLPIDIFPLPKQKLTCIPTGDNNTENKNDELAEYIHARAYALGTLHFVEYKLIGYRLGELQKVETVLKGETRKNITRQLLKSNKLMIDDSINNQEQNKLQHLADKDFTSQIQKTLAERKVTTTANDYTTSYQATAPDAKTSGSWTIDDTPAGGNSKNHAKFIKDVLAETKQRVVAQVNHARQTKLVNEHETSNINTFTNNTDENINGFYYWLNKKYQVQASDSQKRLLVEINFGLQDTELKQILAEQGKLIIKPPTTLQQQGINSYADILPEDPVSKKQGQQELSLPQNKSNYYLDLYQQFSITEVSPPPKISYFIATTMKSQQSATNSQIEIPEGYLINSVNVVISAGDDITNFSVMIADRALAMEKGESGIFTGSLTADELQTPMLGYLPVAILAQFNTNTEQSSSEVIQAPIAPPQRSQVINIQVQLTRSNEILSQWQFAVFNQLQAGYQEQLANYNEKLIERKQWLSLNNTPKTQTLINNYLIKKCMHRLYLNAMSHIGIDPTAPLDELPYNQYFSKALDWPHLYCKLFNAIPVNTTSKAPLDYTSTSGVLEQLDSELYLKDFLTATKAKVLLPINREQVFGFLYFLDSGQIWHGAEQLTPVNQQALPIVNDFKKLTASPETKKTNSWTVTLPTTMAVLTDGENINDIGNHLDEN